MESLPPKAENGRFTRNGFVSRKIIAKATGLLYRTACRWLVQLTGEMPDLQPVRKYFNRGYRTITVLLLILLLVSCSYYRQFYIINVSDEECTITVQLNVPVRDYESRDSLFYLDDPGIRIDSETRKHLTKRLGYKIPNEYTMVIDLPSSGTVFLGGTSSIDPWPYASVTITADDREIVFSDKEILKKFKRNNIFSLAHYYVFE